MSLTSKTGTGIQSDTGGRTRKEDTHRGWVQDPKNIQSGLLCLVKGKNRKKDSGKRSNCRESDETA